MQTKQIDNTYYFDNETRQKIGAVTYIVAAHFDETRENLKNKINHLLHNEIEQSVARHSGLSQSSAV